MVKSGSFLLAAAALMTAPFFAGCTSEAKQKVMPLSWSRLPDGSWLSAAINDPKFDEVARCWPQQSGFDCLSVFVGGGTIMPSRFASRDLPKEIPTQEAGYSCMSGAAGSGLLHENISGSLGEGKASTLKSHSVNPTSESSSLWTRAEVNGFMTANRVKGSLHYDCPYVVKLVEQGSYLSIGTTDLTYRQFLGLDNPENPKIFSGTDDPLSAAGPVPRR